MKEPLKCWCEEPKIIYNQKSIGIQWKEERSFATIDSVIDTYRENRTKDIKSFWRKVHRMWEWEKKKFDNISSHRQFSAKDLSEIFFSFFLQKKNHSSFAGEEYCSSENIDEKLDKEYK